MLWFLDEAEECRETWNVRNSTHDLHPSDEKVVTLVLVALSMVTVSIITK